MSISQQILIRFKWYLEKILHRWSGYINSIFTEIWAKMRLIKFFPKYVIDCNWHCCDENRILATLQFDKDFVWDDIKLAIYLLMIFKIDLYNRHGRWSGASRISGKQCMLAIHRIDYSHAYFVWVKVLCGL